MVLVFFQFKKFCFILLRNCYSSTLENCSFRNCFSKGSYHTFCRKTFCLALPKSSVGEIIWCFHKLHVFFVLVVLSGGDIWPFVLTTLLLLRVQKLSSFLQNKVSNFLFHRINSDKDKQTNQDNSRAFYIPLNNFFNRKRTEKPSHIAFQKCNRKHNFKKQIQRTSYCDTPVKVSWKCMK